MDCKHPYYKIKDGQLVCSQCEVPAPNKKQVTGAPIEDKIAKGEENKRRGWPKGKKRS